MGAKNAKQARAAIDAMVQALGGQAWLNQKNVERQGQVAAFFHGRPDLGTTEYFDFINGRITTGSSTRSTGTWCSFTWTDG